MKSESITRMLLIVLLINVLVWKFSIQQAEIPEPPTIEWNRTYGGMDYDWAWSVVQTSDGGYAMAGLTWSFGVAGPDFWLVKVDSSGNMQWDKTYGGSSDDGAYSVVQTSDGGYAIAGYTNSFGVENYDFWLVKADSAGNLEWTRTYGGPNVESAHSIIETNDGGYMLAGYTDSLEPGGHDLMLVKVDASGNMQWNRTYGGDDNEAAWCIIETDDKEYVLAGATASFGMGGYDFWLVKVDSFGNLQWNTTYGGLDNDIARSLVSTGDGGYAIAGYTNSFGAGGYDFWLVKVDSSGNLEWSRTYGGLSDDVARSLVKTSDEGYAMAGHTWSFGAGLNDFWLVKVDAYSNIQWNGTYGGTDVDSAYSLVETTDGGYVLAGYTASFGMGGYDFWLVKVNQSQDVHDLAVIEVVPFRTAIGQGFCLNINVSVQNQGSISENFNITAYADQNTITIGDEIIIETQMSTLADGDFTTIMFTWNTTDIAKGNYTLSAVITPLPGELDTADNTYIDGIITIREPIHDIAVVNVTPSKTVIGKGLKMNVSVTVENQGDYPETFNLTTYVNTTILGFVNLNLTDGNFATSTFVWNTTEFEKGNFTISACVTPVPSENTTENNILLAVMEVCVTIPGDVDADLDVDIFDIVKIASVYGSKERDSAYVSNYDINCDGQIDIFDVVTAAGNYGKADSR
ncbi:MAG: CARDB domain-containing protein [Candidatus Bathyarchaeia archaeon]